MNPSFFTFLFSQVIAATSFASSALPTYFCQSEHPRGAVYLKLDLENKNSIGRISTPFTSDLNVLKLENPPPSEYTKLNVGHVEKLMTVGGRPVCGDCLLLNASVHELSDNELVLEQTKSKLSYQRISSSSWDSALFLNLHTDEDRFLRLQCEKLN